MIEHYSLGVPLSADPTISRSWADPRFVFILVEPSHAGNIGSAARALAVMGFADLRVVSPRHSDFASHPEAVAFSSGATQLLSAVRSYPDLDSALVDCTLAIAVSAAGREFAAPPMSPESASACALQELARVSAAPSEPQSASMSESRSEFSPPKVAWVFGTERTGLSIAQAQRCQLLCSIESNPVYGSLNLAQAVQVIAYCARQAMAADVPFKETATVENSTLRGHRGFASLEQVEGLMQHLENTLIDIAYLNPAQPKRLMPRLRQLFSRTRLEQEEIDILRGILKTVQKLPRTNPTNRQS